MSIQWIAGGLDQIVRSFRRILADDAPSVIEEAKAELKRSKAKFDELIGKTHHPGLSIEPWGYQIYPDHALRFRPSKAKGGEGLVADLCGYVLWRQEGDWPVSQCLHLRLWSSDENQIWRSEWDAEDVLHMVSGKTPPERVMFRCHFDQANSGQQGPQYHIQFGGNASADEACWFSSSIRLPRLIYPPMDLVLACQLIAANFYWEEYIQFREEAQWVNAIRGSQKDLLARYYEQCHNSLQQNLILLDTLWNVR